MHTKAMRCTTIATEMISTLRLRLTDATDTDDLPVASHASRWRPSPPPVHAGGARAAPQAMQQSLRA